MKIFLTPTLVVMLFAFVIPGCGRSDSGKAASQVAARVNGDEISIHQINLLLARQGPANREQAKTASPQVLERLIDQQLLVQKAMKAKLDRDIQVMQRVEAAKSQILAQAYMEHISSTALNATAEDVRTFYKENPALFSERRVYRFDEIVAQVPEDKLDQLEQVVRKSGTISEVANWLKTQSIRFTGNSAVRAAEQLPIKTLPQLSRMKDGEMVVRRGTSDVAILQLAASRAAAINEQQATQYIQTYLLNRKRNEIANAQMTTLRAAAKIEYVGEYAKTKPASAPAPALVTDQPQDTFSSEDRIEVTAPQGKDPAGQR